jgi:hypothetical protein
MNGRIKMCLCISGDQSTIYRGGDLLNHRKAQLIKASALTLPKDTLLRFFIPHEDDSFTTNTYFRADFAQLVLLCPV